MLHLTFADLASNNLFRLFSNTKTEIRYDNIVANRYFQKSCLRVFLRHQTSLGVNRQQFENFALKLAVVTKPLWRKKFDENVLSKIMTWYTYVGLYSFCLNLLFEQYLIKEQHFVTFCAILLKLLFLFDLSFWSVCLYSFFSC